MNLANPSATPSSSPALRLLAALATLATVAACQPPPPDEPLVIETEEVAPPIDAELTTENDLAAVQEAAQVSGLVPGDVPRDLPLYVPSSVVDFGEAGGRSYVELDAPARPAVVRQWLGQRLPAAGWKVGAIGEGLVQARKGSVSVEYRLIDLAPGTRIRLEYTPR